MFLSNGSWVKENDEAVCKKKDIPLLEVLGSWTDQFRFVKIGFQVIDLYPVKGMGMAVRYDQRVERRN